MIIWKVIYVMYLPGQGGPEKTKPKTIYGDLPPNITFFTFVFIHLCKFPSEIY